MTVPATKGKYHSFHVTNWIEGGLLFRNTSIKIRFCLISVTQIQDLQLSCVHFCIAAFSTKINMISGPRTSIYFICLLITQHSAFLKRTAFDSSEIRKQMLHKFPFPSKIRAFANGNLLPYVYFRNASNPRGSKGTELAITMQPIQRTQKLFAHHWNAVTGTEHSGRAAAKITQPKNGR